MNPNIQDLINTLGTPLVTMAVIWLMNKVMPHIPTWLNPVIAPLIGAGIGFVETWTGQTNVNPLVSALLGTAAVGLHQIKSQWSEHQGSVPPTSPATTTK